MLEHDNPADWIERAGTGYPERVFLRSAVGSMTYGELAKHTGRFAMAMRQRGVFPGDRVAVQAEKSVEAVLVYIACLRLGAAYVPINAACSPNEFEYFVRDSQPRLVVIPPESEVAFRSIGRDAGPDNVVTLGLNGAGTLPQLAAAAAPMTISEQGVGPDSLAAIVYTSGTTGRSKGAMLTRLNLASNAAVLAESWRFSPADTLLHVLPLFHVHGLFVAINTVLASGSALYLMKGFEPVEALQLLREVTVFMGVPTHYTRLLQEPRLNREVTGGMRLFVSGSAPLQAETHREFAQRTGHIILERYGMTETLMNASNPYAGDRLAGSVGTPLPGVSVRAVDPEGREVDAEEIGDLQIRGPNVFAGYWRDAEKTCAQFTSDGWFRTGDLGRRDGRGYYFIVGRARDLVISGGYNVYPKEVEAELDAIPGVVESAVFGVRHADFGEGVTAAVVLGHAVVLTEAQIIAIVRPRLSPYKVPKRVIVMAELPRNTMGKVQKNVLRQNHAALYD